MRSYMLMAIAMMGLVNGAAASSGVVYTRTGSDMVTTVNYHTSGSL